MRARPNSSTMLLNVLFMDGPYVKRVKFCKDNLATVKASKEHRALLTTMWNEKKMPTPEEPAPEEPAPEEPTPEEPAPEEPAPVPAQSRPVRNTRHRRG